MNFELEDYNSEEVNELCREISEVLEGEKAFIVISALHKITKKILESEIHCT